MAQLVKNLPATQEARLLRQAFCFFAFLFIGDGLDPCLLYNVMNLYHSSSGTLSDLVP